MCQRNADQPIPAPCQDPTRIKFGRQALNGSHGHLPAGTGPLRWGQVDSHGNGAGMVGLDPWPVGKRKRCDNFKQQKPCALYTQANLHSNSCRLRQRSCALWLVCYILATWPGKVAWQTINACIIWLAPNHEAIEGWRYKSFPCKAGGY